MTGKKGDASAWSFGEAMPSNNKNAYPFAMAEKRAKDRVILKLIGLSGDAYSEDEADDFKEAKPKAKSAPPRRSKADSREDYTSIQGWIDAAQDMPTLFHTWKESWPKIQTMHIDFEDQITERKDDKRRELEKVGT